MNTDDSDDTDPVAVTSEKEEGGSSKTAACILALRDLEAIKRNTRIGYSRRRLDEMLRRRTVLSS